ncbi:MAG TPA: hypothetical protein VNC41_05605 [Acidimicrobiia bacterium]|nr:hypothetical protein [Acidimicrobiia bacterium]
MRVKLVALLTVLIVASELGFFVAGLASEGSARVVLLFAAIIVPFAITMPFALYIERLPAPTIDPESRFARFQRWAENNPGPHKPRYCPGCGRERWWVPTVSYLPPTEKEQRAYCCPGACEFYDEPSLAAPRT